MPDSPERILLLRHDKIGDAIISTPVFGRLRERFPAARIDVLLGRKNAAVALLLPYIDNAYILDRGPADVIGTLRMLRRNRYDVVLDLLVNDSASGAMLAALCGARCSIGFGDSARATYDRVIERARQPMHIVCETSLLLAPLSIPPIEGGPGREAEWPLRLEITDGARDAVRAKLARRSAGRPLAILNISGSAPSRSMTDRQTIELCGRLSAAGITPMLAGRPDELAHLKQLAADCDCEVAPMSWSLAEFAATLEQADVVLAMNSGAAHIAAAMERPTVMLSVHDHLVNPWRPWGVPYRSLNAPDEVASIPVDAISGAIVALVTESVRELP